MGSTRIFARAATNDAEQLLAYSMSVELEEELAMVLPLPVPPSPADDAVRFIDLHGYDDFFDHLEAAFPPDYSASPQALSRGGFGPPEKAKLVVHDVGSFEASFVPTPADFARLDERFRMPEGVWSRLPQYADFGFAVFKLKTNVKKGFFSSTAKRERIHPMAFSFPRRDASALFFPTVHVHDGGTVPEKANFDHMLFCQATDVLEATLPWTKSNVPLETHVDRTRAKDLVDVTRAAYRKSIWGPANNDDVVLKAPSGVTLADLAGRGDTYAYRVRAEAAYEHSPWDEMRHAWKRTAQTKLPELCRALREGLPPLLDARRSAWSLTKLDDALPVHFVNGTQLWTGTDYTNGKPANPGGPGRVNMQIFSKRVEQQDITLGFARLPDQRALDEIRSTLAALVARAAD